MENDAPAGFLSPEEEAELVERAQAGDPFATNKLLDAHEPIIWSTVNAYVDERRELERNLEDAARQGLYDAWLSYDPDRGHRFGAYARTVIRRRVRAEAERCRETETEGEDGDIYLNHETGPDKPGKTYEDLTADPYTEAGGSRAVDAALDAPDVSEIARQIDRLRQQAESVERVLDEHSVEFTQRQIFVLKAALNGWTPPRMADHLDARKDSVERSLDRAAEKVSEYVEQGQFYDPFSSVEAEQGEEPLDPFTEAEAEVARQMLGDYTRHGGIQ